MLALRQVLSGAQLFSAYTGEGEARLRAAFARARQAAPAILFIDEIDAVGGRREDSGTGGGGSGARLLSALLTEMDGLELATGAYVGSVVRVRACLTAVRIAHRDGWPGAGDRHGCRVSVQG